MDNEDEKIWGEGTLTVEYGDMTKERVGNIIIGHSHLIHRSLFFKDEFKDEFKAYSYLLDTVQDLGICSYDEISDWEKRMDFYTTLQGCYVGSSTPVVLNNDSVTWINDDV